MTVSIKDTSDPRLPGPRFRTDDSQLITLPVVHVVLLTEGLSAVQLVAGAPARPAGAQRGSERPHQPVTGCSSYAVQSGNREYSG
ncbi:MAG: hypothetical protein OXF01_17410, partial [Gemmatimonadetes bacterium]|nr:hypothetical protein [Gemmatimonadota bacterium]